MLRLANGWREILAATALGMWVGYLGELMQRSLSIALDGTREQRRAALIAWTDLMDRILAILDDDDDEDDAGAVLGMPLLPPPGDTGGGAPPSPAPALLALSWHLADLAASVRAALAVVADDTEELGADLAVATARINRLEALAILNGASVLHGVPEPWEPAAELGREIYTEGNPIITRLRLTTTPAPEVQA